MLFAWIVFDTSIFFFFFFLTLKTPSFDEVSSFPLLLFKDSLLFESVDKVFESSDSKTSSLDRETLDGSLSTFESLDTEISDESAVFSSGTESSYLSSTKLVVYESVTLTSLAWIALTDNRTVNNTKKVSNIFLFKIIYLLNKIFKQMRIFLIVFKNFVMEVN